MAESEQTQENPSLVYPWVDKNHHKIIFDKEGGEDPLLDEDFISVEHSFGQTWVRANILEPLGLFFYSFIYALIVFFVYDYGGDNYDNTINAFLVPVLILIFLAYKGSQSFFRAIFYTVVSVLFIILPLYNEGLITVDGIFLLNIFLRGLEYITPYLAEFDIYTPANLNNLDVFEIFNGVLVAVFIFELILMIFRYIAHKIWGRNHINLTISNKSFYLRKPQKTSVGFYVKAVLMIIVSPFNVRKYLQLFKRIHQEAKAQNDDLAYNYGKFDMVDINELKRHIYTKKINYVAGGFAAIIAALLIFNIIPIVELLVFDLIPLNYLIAVIPITIAIVFFVKKPKKRCNITIHFDPKSAEGQLLNVREYNMVTFYALSMETAEKFSAAKEIIISDDYEDYYTVKDGKLKFDLLSYRYYDKGKWLDRIAKVVVAVVVVAFVVYGFWNGYYLLDHLISSTFSGATDYWPIIAGWIKDYGPNIVYALLGIWVTTLIICYIVVRVFGRLASVFIYGIVILQIVGFGFLYYYVQDWEYRWLFLIPIVIEVLILIFWRDKLQRAIRFTKISTNIVGKVRGLIVPQIFQTIFMLFFGVLHFAITAVTFLGIHESSVTIGDYVISNTDTWVYALASVGFVIIGYMLIYVTLGIKMLMVHEYYRGGRPRILLGLKLVYKRWWQLLTYAFYSSIIHAFQFIRKLIKGEIKIENLLDAAEVTQELAPENPMALDKTKKVVKEEDGKVKVEKKKPPLLERAWFGLNYFTMPSMMIKDRKFFPALIESMRLYIKKLPDLYIKKSKVNVLFRFMQWASIFLSGVVGALAGVLGSNYFGWNIYLAVPTLAGVFYWIAGSTAALVLNDLNMTYIEVMYLYTMDQSYDKVGYSRFELKEAKEVEKELQKEEEKREAKKRAKESEPKLE